MRTQSFNLAPQYHTISDAIVLIKTTLLAFVLFEKYGIEPKELIACIPRVPPKFIFTEAGYRKIVAAEIDHAIITYDENTQSISIDNFSEVLARLAKETKSIINKFPYIEKILNENNYSNPDKNIQDRNLLKRCKRMQLMWGTWAEAGISHIESSLQALCRQLATKMEEPLLLEYITNENGLSIEYQCEIFAEQLYGAKLLDIWNHYLLNQEIPDRKPENFMTWLRSLDVDTLNKFGIKKLNDISRVHYITTTTERAQYQLEISENNSVTNEKLPKPTEPGQTCEIIFALAKNDSDQLSFFGGIKIRGVINHSSFFAGQKVDGAGRMELVSEVDTLGELCWVIKSMDNNSGHIKPTNAMSMSILLRLQELGVDLKKIQWQSKWESTGLADETADLALKRLSKKWENIDIATVPPPAESKIIYAFDDLSNQGKLKEMHDFLLTQKHRIATSEVIHIALGALNGIRLHSNSAAAPPTQEDLFYSALITKKVLRLVQKAGIHSFQLEKRFTETLIDLANKRLIIANEKVTASSDHPVAANEIMYTEAFYTAIKETGSPLSREVISSIKFSSFFAKSADVNTKTVLVEAKNDPHNLTRGRKNT